jgi:hypothetical protein
MKRLAVFVLLVVSIPVLGACATIVHGSSQNVNMMSAPAGAKVSVNGMPMGATPAILSLDRRQNHVVKYELEGYQPVSLELKRGVSGWIVGNIVFGGIIGLVVDAATGSMYKLSPEQLSATLAGQVGVGKTGDVLMITTVMKVDPSWEKIGELVAIR